MLTLLLCSCLEVVDWNKLYFFLNLPQIWQHRIINHYYCDLLWLEKYSGTSLQKTLWDHCPLLRGFPELLAVFGWDTWNHTIWNQIVHICMVPHVFVLVSMLKEWCKKLNRGKGEQSHKFNRSSGIPRVLEVLYITSYNYFITIWLEFSL